MSNSRSQVVEDVKFSINNGFVSGSILENEQLKEPSL